MAKLTNEHFQQLLNDGEEAIRSGQGHAFRQQLESLNTAQIPDSFRLPLANLSRRAGLVTLALRILSPRMPLSGLESSASTSASEMAEYALLLQRIGSLSEALRLLENIDASKEPKALLYRAFCLFKTWEHKTSLPFLKQYVDNTEDPYQKVVGQLNLAAAHCIAGDYETSLHVTEEILQHTHSNEKWRLYANALELKAQNLIHVNKPVEAEENIERASKILESHKTFDALFVKKWAAYLESLKSGSVEPMKKFKERALKEEAFESAREADLYSLLIHQDLNVYDHVYFGTPFEAYKARIESLTQTVSPSVAYFLGKPGTPLFDVEAGTLQGDVVLPLGKKVHQVLELLTRDLYRPLKLGDMFSNLYEGEHFDINSSPERIYQLVKRTRQFLKDSALPLEVQETHGFYQLQVTGPLTIKINRTRQSVEGLNPYLQQLKSLYQPSGNTFKTADVRECLNLKLSKAREVLELGLSSGEIIKMGSSSATKYQFVTQTDSN